MDIQSYKLKKATTSKLIELFIGDSSVTTGAGKTGLAFNTGSLTAYYMREGDASMTPITLATATVGTWTDSGFKEVDSTNAPGLYEFGIPNAVLATGVKAATIFLKGASGMRPIMIQISLIAVDEQDAVRLGLSSLPNAAAGANTGLPVVGTQIPNANAGANTGLPIVGTQVPNATAGAVNGLPLADASGAVKVSSGTGANQINLTSGGVVLSDVTAIWNALVSTLTTASSIGKLLVDNINATISSRLASSAITLSGGSVTVGTNSDKTGYALTSGERTSIAVAVWAALTSGLVTAGSIGLKLANWVLGSDSKVLLSTDAQSGVTIPTVTTLTTAPTITAPVTVGTNNDKTGYRLSATGVSDIIDGANVELASIPTGTSSLRTMIQFLFEYFRNKRTVTATTETLLKEDSATPLGTSTVSNDGTTFVHGKLS